MPITAAGTAQVHRDRLAALAAPGGSVYLHMLKTMTRIDARAKYYLNGVMVGKRTGNLISSQAAPMITPTGRGVLGVLQNNASYAKAVHDGTVPHEIRAVRKKTLKFSPSTANHAAGTGGGSTSTGQFVFPKAVQHPGTKPRPFLRRAMTDVVLTGH